MNSKKLTRAIIETAVDRGIKDISSDPKRSLRRLADLGKQFSTGKFQKLSFSHITNLLRKDDSPYYKMLEDFLGSVDHRMIKNFGLNIGYDSWTYGARLMRRSSEDLGFLLPWVLIIHYDTSLPSTLTASDLSDMIDAVTPLGINTFVIIPEHITPDDKDLINVLRAHKECVFFLFPEDGQISLQEVLLIKQCENTVISVNIATPDAGSVCRMLKKNRALYVIHYHYSAGETDHLIDMVDHWLSFESAFIFLFQKDDHRGLGGALAKKTRMDQDYPILIWDVYADIRRVENMIYDTDKPYLLEISADGSICYPEDTGLNVKTSGIISAIEKTAPLISSPQ